MLPTARLKPHTPPFGGEKVPFNYYVECGMNNVWARSTRCGYIGE